jgi:hypothetical protein
MSEVSPAKRPRPTRADAKKRKISPEGRQRLSELAKQRHAEGRFGGSKYGKLGGRGNTREKRLAQQAVAEAAGEEENRALIIQVFKDAVDPERPMGQRLLGAKEWLAVEREAAKLALQEERASAEHMDRAALIAALRESLSRGPAAMMIRDQLAARAGIIDGTGELIDGDDD